MSTASYKSEYFSLELNEGILHVTYIGGPITLDVAQELVSQRLKMSEMKDIPVLVDTINVNGIEREARNYLSGEEGLKGLTAGAIVTNSVFSKHMANFFIKISFGKSKMPARVFSDEHEAVEWLRQFKL